MNNNEIKVEDLTKEQIIEKLHELENTVNKLIYDFNMKYREKVVIDTDKPYQLGKFMSLNPIFLWSPMGDGLSSKETEWLRIKWFSSIKRE